MTIKQILTLVVLALVLYGAVTLAAVVLEEAVTSFHG